VLIPSQIRALRLKTNDMTQKKLAELAGMAQPRISAMESPGETAFNIETLVRLAAAFKVGLKVEFVPFSEMLRWENDYSQDQFDVVRLDQDRAFLSPIVVPLAQAPVIGTSWITTKVLGAFRSNTTAEPTPRFHGPEDQREAARANALYGAGIVVSPVADPFFRKPFPSGPVNIIHGIANEDFIKKLPSGARMTQVPLQVPMELLAMKQSEEMEKNGRI